MMSSTVESNFCFVDKNRAILILEGKDKVDFLQALTTNNIENIPERGYGVHRYFIPSR